MAWPKAPKTGYGSLASSAENMAGTAMDHHPDAQKLRGALKSRFLKMLKGKAGMPSMGGSVRPGTAKRMKASQEMET